MKVQENGGGCFWAMMVVFALIGVFTFPYGIAIWAIQVYAIIKIFRTPNND